jgi:signal transduction histidine kinase
LDHHQLKDIISLLEKRNNEFLERERDLADQKEELQSQKEELTAAIEALILKNSSLAEALQKLQQRNEELDQVLYRTSHDLKTPVSSLQGLLDLLSSDGLTPDQQNLHGYMQQKVLQMNSILKSLGMLAEASFEKIDLKSVDLEKTTRQVILDLSYLPNFTNVTITPEFHISTVNADELMIYNILKPLVSNAIIFRDSIQPGLIEIVFTGDENKLVLKVFDDGEGIMPEIGSKIFDMFYRGSERSHGSGLGLYIVKSVVQRMKGEIQWNSEPGKTLFQITLPAP